MNNLIMGRRGLGKSTLAEFLALQLNRDLVIFDANNQFKDAEHRTSDVQEVEEILDAHSSSDDPSPLSLSYIPLGDVESDWNKFARAIWNFGDYSLIVDEAHRLQKPQYVNLWLDRFMRQAPRRERNDAQPIDIIQTYHRPTDVNGIVLGLADYAYVFRTTKRRDVEWIEKEWGEELASAVQQLRTPPIGVKPRRDDPRDVIKVPIEEPSEYEVITDPHSWYVDIRKRREAESLPVRATKPLKELLQ